MRYILAATEDRAATAVIRAAFRRPFQVDAAATVPDCREFLRKRRYEFSFIDLDLLGGLGEVRGDSGAALRGVKQLFPTVEIVVMTPPERAGEAVEAVKAGAANYVTYPLNADEIRYVTESVHEGIRAQSELDYLRDRFWRSDSLDVVQTRNQAMQAVFDQVRLVAPTKSTVLLTGETGTGKGVLAKLIHRHSNRRGVQFIGIHCGAIPDTLLESELFGHERGAFTGAVRRKLGKFELANRGTIFLDEIGTITPSAQIKLLQVLQDRTFQRVGGETVIETDVRIIAASNQDLGQMVEKGLFRNDLYYRLNVFPIEIPPLRERREDIPQLTEIFLRQMNRFNHRGIHYVHPQVMEAFQRYPWPGNIRELENLVERACILETSSILTQTSFPAELFTRAPSALSAPTGRTGLTLAEARARAVAEVEKSYLQELLARTGGRINRTAESAGVTVRQISKLMRKNNIRKETFR
ncbi:MAG: Fis family transcriptional regulator [Syntrophobacterales bacterium CG_4_8_14_3_um_filter_58_8]|nr:MAG: Fis family transcriptional regulator [Syntrophobacterales bacterium CG03_land_8_20_14_0_80_58_14]PJC76247.1 MAG: Fis family transcriptional regulator [Syntrophobacterales bacterium CG_4_8_14_3_um_filter_58_8]